MRICSCPHNHYNIVNFSLTSGQFHHTKESAISLLLKKSTLMSPLTIAQFLTFLSYQK